MSDLARWREAALAICNEADRIALAGFRRDIEVDTKPDRSFVTAADRAIERMARERLRSAFPGCGLVGEEEGTDAADASVCWYIDPIDATANFVRGIPIFATLLAVALEGELQLGVVSAPALRERWVAWRGGGAWRGDQRLAVSRDVHYQKRRRNSALSPFPARAVRRGSRPSKADRPKPL